jgi:hypothetical protein
MRWPRPEAGVLGGRGHSAHRPRPVWLAPWGEPGQEERCESGVCPRARLEEMGSDTHLRTVSGSRSGTAILGYGWPRFQMVRLGSEWRPYGTHAVWAGRLTSSIMVCVMSGLRTESRDQHRRRGQRNGLRRLGGLGCHRRMDRKFPSPRRRTNAGTQTAGRRSRRIVRWRAGIAARHGLGRHLSQRWRLASRAWWRRRALGDPQPPR